MYEHIIVPLNFATAVQALPYAERMAKAFESEIDLVASTGTMADDMLLLQREMNFEEESGNLGRTWLTYEQYQTIHKKLGDAARKRLETRASELRAKGLKVTTTVQEGESDDVIVAEAQKNADSLVVMATHGRAGVSRLVSGSVTNEVVRHAGRPVMVVRAKEDGIQPGSDRLRMIVLALDGSELAENAIPHAVEIGKRLNLPVEVLGVLEEGPLGAEGGALRATRQHANDYLEKIVARLKGEGVADVSAHVEPGEPASIILDRQGTRGDILVIITTHGRSGLSRWLMGSVTERVVRSGTGPVLVAYAGTAGK